MRHAWRWTIETSLNSIANYQVPMHNKETTITGITELNHSSVEISRSWNSLRNTDEDVVFFARTYVFLAKQRKLTTLSPRKELAQSRNSATFHQIFLSILASLSIFGVYLILSLTRDFTMARCLSLSLSLQLSTISSVLCRSFPLALFLCLPLSPAYNSSIYLSRLWILLSNTYTARTAIQARDVHTCVCKRATRPRARACCKQASGKARVLIPSIYLSHSRGNSRGFVASSGPTERRSRNSLAW